MLLETTVNPGIVQYKIIFSSAFLCTFSVEASAYKLLYTDTKPLQFSSYTVIPQSSVDDISVFFCSLYLIFVFLADHKICQQYSTYYDVPRNVQGFYFRFLRHPRKLMNNENLWNYGISNSGTIPQPHTAGCWANEYINYVNSYLAQAGNN